MPYDEFVEKCRFVSAYHAIKVAMAEVQEVADEELWKQLDDIACELKKKGQVERLHQTERVTGYPLCNPPLTNPK